MNLHPRNVFKEQIQKKLIGPGSDVFGLDEREEIIVSYPLKTYYSGILFPERTVDKSEDNPENSGEEISGEENYNDSENTLEIADSPPAKAPKEENAVKDLTEANHYYPSNMGLTVCLPMNITSIDVTFNAATYKDLSGSWTDRKIKINKDDYEALKNNIHFPFKDELWCEEISAEEVFMSISIPTKTKNEEIRKRLNPFKVNKEIDRNIRALGKFELLISAKLSKRIELQNTVVIPIEDGLYDIFLNEKGESISKCHVRVIKHGDKNYVKLLMTNSFSKHPKNKFSFTNEVLNQKCLFQSSITVICSELEPYKSYLAENPYDEEANLIEYQYRNLKSYGIGHSTSIIWDIQNNTPQWIKTTSLPEIDTPSVSNGFREGEENLKEIASVKNLSIWSNLSQDETCEKLIQFVSAYQIWIDKQKETAIKETNKYQDLSKNLIEKQQCNANRLLKNIELLKTDKQVFKCFQLTNTAMFIQMVISRDIRFGNTEKDATDIKDGKDIYANIDFFKNHNGKDEKGNNVTYRPFQLAFLLLNLEGIINPESNDRTNVVDLIWFPTGGGKTEAYLAVTAFTILWRRLQHPDNYEGVSVIMRYTLRLLTAQQFERASRLIMSLEFLRLHAKELILGEKPISIGMWVGMTSSPNTLKEAQEKIGEGNNPDENSIQGAILKLNRVDSTYSIASAEQKNVFQISACPWCGCKVITQRINLTSKKEEFAHAFDVNKGRFKITCINPSCAFHSQHGLPLDVVDESLYNHPPTLLFATVDKFAMLAHQELGHRFFNSLPNDKGLPPDLIIQDELHLLNGPLGSITGLFEILVERLCTKNGNSPKIIASTATTRNTQEQIGNLYGGRNVNIFPPQGITYDDNYFSKITNSSLRKYIGFMPTGKTMIDTQVQAMLPTLLYARTLLYEPEKDTKDLSDYWTIVSYYNSLKQVGKIYNKIGDEVLSELRRLHNRFASSSHSFNYQGLVNRTTELTSRVESNKIKNILKDLEKDWKLDNEKKYVKDTVDLVLASNMFSVGIDIGRLNVILMNGQPKNIAEYIQASSRVARSREGIVINLLDANVAREKSYFENYIPFHQAYYKFVEPLTVTPFTEITFHKVLNGILIGYVRHIKGLNKNKDAQEFDGNIDDLIELVRNRISENGLKNLAEKILRELADDFYQKVLDKKEVNQHLVYKELIEDVAEESQWALMKSMREVDTNSVIKINSNIKIENQNHEQEVHQ